MDRPQIKETICKYCNEMFPSKGKYQYHFQRVHQNEVKVRHFDQERASIHRSVNEKFTCICDKSYQTGQSLCRHRKNCQQWKNHEANYEPDSDSEISIQGNIICILIGILTFRYFITRTTCFYSSHDNPGVCTNIISFATCIGFCLQNHNMYRLLCWNSI